MLNLKHILLVFVLAGCTSSEIKMAPGIVPNTAKEKQVVKVMPDNVIGEVEPIYLLPPETLTASKDSKSDKVRLKNIKILP